MISKYFFARNCLSKSASTTLFIVNTFAFLMNKIIKKIQFWRSRFFKRCIFCIRTVFFSIFFKRCYFFFHFRKSISKKKNFAFARFVSLRLLKRKKRWQKKKIISSNSTNYQSSFRSLKNFWRISSNWLSANASYESSSNLIIAR